MKRDYANPLLLSTKQIMMATIAALVLGIVIFVIAVLPAEYGSDPSGAGKRLGFDRLYRSDEQVSVAKASDSFTANFPILEIKDLGSDPKVPMPKEAQNPAPATQYAERQDRVEVRVAAGKGIEYKVKVLKYGSLKYAWATDQGTLYSDFHGEVKEEKKPEEEFYLSYTEAYSNNVAGTFLAPYEGRHGWYFKNESTRDVTVTLRLSGQYELE